MAGELAFRAPLRWKPREEPLEARAAAGRGALAIGRLIARLLRLDEAALGALEGVVAAEAIVVLGGPDRLPWVDGIEYLGRDVGAPRLLVPTCLEPMPHVSLLEQALCSRLELDDGPVAVLPAPLTVVPLTSARPLARELLRSWTGSAL